MTVTSSCGTAELGGPDWASTRASLLSAFTNTAHHRVLRRAAPHEFTARQAPPPDERRRRADGPTKMVSANAEILTTQGSGSHCEGGAHRPIQKRMDVETGVVFADLCQPGPYRPKLGADRHRPRRPSRVTDISSSPGRTAVSSSSSARQGLRSRTEPAAVHRNHAERCHEPCKARKLLSHTPTLGEWTRAGEGPTFPCGEPCPLHWPMPRGPDRVVEARDETMVRECRR